MTKPLFELPRTTLPIAGEDAVFPVRRVYCVGRNYAAHAAEMGANPAEDPIFFMKPGDAVALAIGAIPFPGDTGELHHEVELVLALGEGGRDLAPEAAEALIYGYAVGIDLTKRDRQAEAKAAGAPWERAKSFDRSALVSMIRPAARFGHIRSGPIWLSIDGQQRQSADLSEMVWNPANIIARLSRIWALAPGDLIFTGTPAGVGPIRPGDLVVAGIGEVGRIEMRIGG